MRTTIDISEEKLNKAISLAGGKTKKDIINMALDDFIRNSRINLFLSLRGKGIIDEDYDIIKLRNSENEE
ncbi:MAG: type II toxin-antitoxin system VapB family antitoxin [Lentisphaerota bacterium]